jgi:hypothetical protein
VVGVVTGAISASWHRTQQSRSSIPISVSILACLMILQIYRHRRVNCTTYTQTLQGVIATNSVSLWAVKVHFPEKSRERHHFFVVFCWYSILEPNFCSIYIPVSFLSRSDTNNKSLPSHTHRYNFRSRFLYIYFLVTLMCDTPSHGDTVVTCQNGMGLPVAGTKWCTHPTSIDFFQYTFYFRSISIRPITVTVTCHTVACSPS